MRFGAGFRLVEPPGRATMNEELEALFREVFGTPEEVRAEADAIEAQRRERDGEP